MYRLYGEHDYWHLSVATRSIVFHFPFLACYALSVVDVGIFTPTDVVCVPNNLLLSKALEKTKSLEWTRATCKSIASLTRILSFVGERRIEDCLDDLRQCE